MDTWLTASLPESVRRGLLIGSEGKMHLLSLAQDLLRGVEGQRPEQGRLSLDLGLDLVHAAWTKDPLDGQVAGQLLALQEKWPRLPARTLPLLREIAACWRRPEDMRFFRRLAETRDSEKLHRFLTTQLTKEPDNLFWRQQVLALGFFEQDRELLDAVLRRDWSGYEPCRALVGGDVAWIFGQREKAAMTYASALGTDALWRRGEVLFSAGKTEQARAVWRAVVRDEPWRTGEVLRLYDLVRTPRSVALDGRVAVALYTYNKAAELDATLSSLFASDLGENPVWVLNNGSTDGTADMLAGWAARVGERLHLVPLHVNIGAPAARNWLMGIPEVQACRWLVYLDDDVELPVDWLRRLAEAVELYPDAGVWGCKVVDHAAPAVLQSVDLHLTPAVLEEDLAAGRRFKVSELHHQTLDFGQFDYVRPCASVTGCCHVFRMDRLLECGGFDLRFSPSQYDDLEHDIRLNLAGRYAVYHGGLRIRHKKRTGKSSRNSTAEFGNSYANMYKLQKKYAPAEYARLMAWEADVLERDFRHKHAVVREWLAGEDA